MGRPNSQSNRLFLLRTKTQGVHVTDDVYTMKSVFFYERSKQLSTPYNTHTHTFIIFNL